MFDASRVLTAGDFTLVSGRCFALEGGSSLHSSDGGPVTVVSRGVSLRSGVWYFTAKVTLHPALPPATAALLASLSANGLLCIRNACVDIHSL